MAKIALVTGITGQDGHISRNFSSRRAIASSEACAALRAAPCRGSTSWIYRPAEVDLLVGNPEKAQENLGWRRKVGFQELVTLMAEADYDRRDT